MENVMAENVNGAENVNINNEKTTLLNIHSDIGTNATLNFFTKPTYLTKIQKKYISDSKNDKINNSENIKFYKKRIVSLFKDFLKDDEPSNCSSELKRIYELFVNNSIHYFETVDKQDIIQKEHITTNEENNNTEYNNILDMDTIQTLIGDTIEDANSIMMRKTVEIPSLNNYVIQKTEPNNSDNVKKIIPLKLDIDLKNPILKTKGVRPKGLKKNVKKKDEDVSDI